MVEGGKTDGSRRPGGRGTEASPAAARELEPSAREARGGFPSPPGSSARGSQLQPSQKERQTPEATRKQVLLTTGHVSARCPGSNASDPAGTPRTVCWGLCRPRGRMPGLEGGRGAGGPARGVLQETPKTEPAARSCPRGSGCLSEYCKRGVGVTDRDAAGSCGENAHPRPPRAQLRGLLREARAAAAGGPGAGPGPRWGRGGGRRGGPSRAL